MFLTMLVYTAWAGTRQSLLQWGGLAALPDRYWTIATLMDAYFGFTTFYVWLFFKERGWPARVAWFIAIVLLGTIAMSAYLLLRLALLRPEEPASNIWSLRDCGADRS
jgi:hypothetical protein